MQTKRPGYLLGGDALRGWPSLRLGAGLLQEPPFGAGSATEAYRAVLKATVKATPVDTHEHGSTIRHVGFAPEIQNKP